ncbi:MAG: hypothetical protein KDB22_29045 [Planctomycetales bacterium]|nr:hypothetical protein [Planctomycetales bacterium]
MLFLGDPQYNQLPGGNPFFGLIVPDQHMLAAARSPRRKRNYKHFLTAILIERDRPTIVDDRKRESNMTRTDLWCLFVSHSRCDRDNPV